MSPTRWPSTTPADDPALVRNTWLGSRLLLAGVALAVVTLGDRSWRSVLGNWDVQHYMSIARQGYADPLEMAFLPGLPALLRLGADLGVPMEVAGAVIALVSSALAAWALFRIGGTVPACLWLIAPTTVFTTVGYTEAPFCAAAFWAWERARANHWWAAALLTGLAATMRVSGLFLIGALAVMAVVGDGMDREPGRRRTKAPSAAQRVNHLATLVIPVAVVAAFVVWLHHLTGSWTAWQQAQDRGWGRGFTTPVETWRNTLPATSAQTWRATYGDHAGQVAAIFRLELVSVAVGIATTVYCLVRRRWASAAWVGVQVVAFSVGHWYMSVNRAVLLWFPLMIALAELTRGPDRPVGLKLAWRGIVGIGVVVALVVMCWWGWLFYTGAWAS